MIRGEVLREVRRITKWKDGCVFQTEHVSYSWFPVESKQARMETIGDLMYCSMPSSYLGRTIRSVVVPDPANS